MILVERRIGLLFASFLALLALAGVRVLYLGLVKGSGLSNAATAQQVAVTKLPAERGMITDRKGVPLAASIPADDVSATPYLIKDPVATANRLSPLIGVPADKLVSELARRDTGFVYLARRLPESTLLPAHCAPTREALWPPKFLALLELTATGYSVLSTRTTRFFAVAMASSAAYSMAADRQSRRATLKPLSLAVRWP